MISEITGSYMPWIKQLMEMTIGETHKTMLFVYVVSVLNQMTILFKKRRPKRIWGKFMEKMFAYTAFITLGNILDELMLNHLSDIKGTSQLLVCLYIVVREIGIMRDYLSKTHGIVIPIFDYHLNKLNQLKDPPRPELHTELEKDIEDLRAKLKALENSSKGD